MRERGAGRPTKAERSAPSRACAGTDGSAAWGEGGKAATSRCQAAPSGVGKSGGGLTAGACAAVASRRTRTSEKLARRGRWRRRPTHSAARLGPTARRGAASSRKLGERPRAPLEPAHVAAHRVGERLGQAGQARLHELAHAERGDWPRRARGSNPWPAPRLSSSDKGVSAGKGRDARDGIDARHRRARQRAAAGASRSGSRVRGLSRTTRNPRRGGGVARCPALRRARRRASGLCWYPRRGGD